MVFCNKTCIFGGLWHTCGDMSAEPLLSLELPGIKKVKSGKVREVFDLGEHLLFVATDRISAFDCIMPNGIPNKGKALTQMSHYWFDQSTSIIGNHRVGNSKSPLPKELEPYSAELEGRSMVVLKAKPLAIECVVRGYLAGSGWKEYKKSQTICGVSLPAGLVESSQLPEPIFTPSTKAETGHDENINFETAEKVVGKEIAQTVRDASIRLYSWARDLARSKGIIIADTKFEFGIVDGKVILIDEVLTPDSSRFWPLDQYQPGKSQPSYDKQFVRDYLETLDWNKQPPAPVLPPEVVEKTAEKYAEAVRRITGCELK